MLRMVKYAIWHCIVFNLKVQDAWPVSFFWRLAFTKYAMHTMHIVSWCQPPQLSAGPFKQKKELCSCVHTCGQSELKRLLSQDKKSYIGMWGCQLFLSCIIEVSLPIYTSVCPFSEYHFLSRKKERGKYDLIRTRGAQGIKRPKSVQNPSKPKKFFCCINSVWNQ